MNDFWTNWTNIVVQNDRYLYRQYHFLEKEVFSLPAYVISMVGPSTQGNTQTSLIH